MNNLYQSNDYELFVTLTTSGKNCASNKYALLASFLPSIPKGQHSFDAGV